MDSIQAQKLEAKKKFYKRAKCVYNLIVYSLTAFLSCLCYLYLFWFPSASMNHFFSVLVPNTYSLFTLSPNKLLFIVGNLIVLFLLGESKLYSSTPSPAEEIYDEYVQRSRTKTREIRSLAAMDDSIFVHRKKSTSVKLMDHDDYAARADSEKKKKLEKIDGKFEGVNINDDEVVVVVSTSNYKVEKVGAGVQEDHQMPHIGDVVVVLLPRNEDELKRRVEDFIARVNRQRMLEESIC